MLSLGGATAEYLFATQLCLWSWKFCSIYLETDANGMQAWRKFQTEILNLNF